MSDYEELHVKFDPQPNRQRFLVAQIALVWLFGIVLLTGIAAAAARLFRAIASWL